MLDISQQFQLNLKEVQNRIAHAAERAGRSPGSIRLIAVTKYVDASIARSLVEAGCRVLGESRPQSLWEKGKKMQDLDVEWHLIGHLQRNKIRKTLLFAQCIHSCDSTRLLDAIQVVAQESNRIVECLLQVNISGETAKHGFSIDEVPAALDRVAQLHNIRLVGLMGMGSLSGDLDQNRLEFRQLRQLLDCHRDHPAENVTLNELSMGMSNDFEVAIEEGATMIRIGSSLFRGIPN